MKNILIFFLWFITIIYTIVWTFENPEKIEKVKDRFKKNKKIEIKVVSGINKNISANAFTLNLSQVLENKNKSAFVIYPNNFKRKFKFKRKHREIFK